MQSIRTSFAPLKLTMKVGRNAKQLLQQASSVACCNMAVRSLLMAAPSIKTSAPAVKHLLPSGTKLAAACFATSTSVSFNNVTSRLQLTVTQLQLLIYSVSFAANQPP